MSKKKISEQGKNMIENVTGARFEDDDLNDNFHQEYLRRQRIYGSEFGSDQRIIDQLNFNKDEEYDDLLNEYERRACNNIDNARRPYDKKRKEYNHTNSPIE